MVVSCYCYLKRRTGVVRYSKVAFLGLNDNKVGRVFAMHAANPYSVSFISYGLVSIPGGIPESKAKSKPENCWVWDKPISYPSINTKWDPPYASEFSVPSFFDITSSPQY